MAIMKDPKALMALVRANPEMIIGILGALKGIEASCESNPD